MNRSDFNEIVQQSIDSLPVKFRKALKNLSIVVEDSPAPELLAEFGFEPDETLLGLYVGVPLPDRAFADEPYLPDQIFIFRAPLEKMCRTSAELRKQIRITLIHEIAHYFGFDEDHLDRLGLG
jgi:predicted Zn-dependent protease with MMP-like domain